MSLIVDGELITGLLSLDEILRHPEKLAGQPPSEIAETRIACAAVSAALAACEPNPANPAPEPESWLTPEQVEKSYPAIKRRFLFANRRDLPFVRNISRKVLLVSEAGLKSWFTARKRR